MSWLNVVIGKNTDSGFWTKRKCLDLHYKWTVNRTLIPKLEDSRPDLKKKLNRATN